MNRIKNRQDETGYFAERPVLLVAGLFLLAAVPIGMMMVLMYGSVSGNEFSPDDFTRRHFEYQRIPWLDWTISGIEYTDVTPELEQSLTISGLINKSKPTGSKQKTWHLYHDSGVPDSHGCDARFLTTYLDFSDWDSSTATSTPFWLKWNEQFPLSATIFWPMIADLARNEMYLIIPNVMRFALNTTNDEPERFQSKLNELTRASWITSGELDLQLGNYQRATERLIRAQLIDSSSEVATLIDRCRDQVAEFSGIKLRAEAAAKRLESEITAALAKKDRSIPSGGKSEINDKKNSTSKGESLPDDIPAEAADDSVADGPANAASDLMERSDP